MDRLMNGSAADPQLVGDRGFAEDFARPIAARNDAQLDFVISLIKQ
ncbi:MAG: hypothetical protein ABSC37_02545 [Xanthobacteraceae bacterium]